MAWLAMLLPLALLLLLCEFRPAVLMAAVLWTPQQTQPDKISFNALLPVIRSSVAALFCRLIVGLFVCDEDREGGGGGHSRQWRNPAQIQHRGPRRRSGKGNTHSEAEPAPTSIFVSDFGRCAPRTPASSPLPPLEATLELKAR